jgi:hypothetical protein
MEVTEGASTRVWRRAASSIFIFVFRRKNTENESGSFQQYMKNIFPQNSYLIATKQIKNQILRKLIFRSCFNEKRTYPY